MLILDRKKGESIIMNVNGKIIKVMVTAHMGGNIKLGIKADDDVIIHREEIYRKAYPDAEF
jgi:carbon storage regulator CsrA